VIISKMSELAKIGHYRRKVEVFDIEGLKNLRVELEKKPNLKKRLGQDFEGTLKAEGIIVDEAFKKEVEKQCRARISIRIKARMAKLPKSKKVYYSMVASGKPIKVRVKIDRKKGKTMITPRSDKK
jgi:hypothetical protein